MRPTSAALAFMLVGLAAAGCAKKKQEAPPPPPTVTVSKPMVRRIVDWDDFVGHFEAVSSVDLRPRVDGYLQTINFRDGQIVRRGQLLFTIDPRPYQATLNQARGTLARAQATLADARIELARSQTLFSGRATSQQDVTTRQTTVQQSAADVQSDQAAVQAAALNVAFTRIVAPVTGRISDRKVSVGNLITANTSVLTTIVTVDPIRFLFTGSEAAYVKYQRENLQGTRRSSRNAANPVQVQIQGDTGYNWHGRMDFVDNVVDQTSGVIRARAQLSNPDGVLTPGLFGHLRLLGSGGYDALLVPDQAVQTDQSRQVVDIVGGDGKVAQRVVELGQLVDGLRVLRKGVNRDDEVVIDGIGAARAGSKVKTKLGRIVAPDPGTSPEPSAPSQGVAS